MVGITKLEDWCDYDVETTVVVLKEDSMLRDKSTLNLHI